MSSQTLPVYVTSASGPLCFVYDCHISEPCTVYDCYVNRALSFFVRVCSCLFLLRVLFVLCLVVALVISELSILCL